WVPGPVSPRSRPSSISVLTRERDSEPRLSARKRSMRWPAWSAVAVMRMGPLGDGWLLADMWMWDNPNWLRMGDSMRALKIATIVMGVLIVAGTTGLIVVIAHRLSG